MLPIEEVYLSLLNALEHHDIVLLQAPPGAGKSTWLPLQLLRDRHFERIIMLEPRRLAARTIAQYLAKCQNEKVGESIGLRIRSEKHISRATKLEVVSEGTLTRMLQNDPELKGIDCIIFDEFHERSLAADTALAFARETQSVLRTDLKILLMSATLDTTRLSEKLRCHVVTSEGRSFPIEEIYHPLKNERNWLEEIPKLIYRAVAEQEGNCLVFLPGQKEIKWVARNLNQLDASISIYSLYGAQTNTEQQAAIAPTKSGQRKIVLSTNVSETSLTIEGIRVVIDSGRKRFAKYNLNTGVTELCTVKTSLSSSTQRAGRAGRVSPGVVYRLGSECLFSQREKHDTPEILTSDISSLVLEAKHWGTKLDQLELIDPPSLAQKAQSIALLEMLEAIDSQHRLTNIGKEILNFGADIRWAHMAIKAKELDKKLPGIEHLSVFLLALLDSRVSDQRELSSSIQNQYRKPKRLFKTHLDYWRARLKIKNIGEPSTRYLPILLALAYPDRIAKRRGKGYLLANGAGADSVDDCWFQNDFIAIAELGGPKGTHIFSGSSVDIFDLKNHLPYLFYNKIVCEIDEKSGRFIYESRLMLGSIVVTSQPCLDKIEVSTRTSSWIKYIKKNGLSIFEDMKNISVNDDSNDTAQLLTRMILANRLDPGSYPSVSMDLLLSTLEDWLSPYLDNITTLDQLKKFKLKQPLKEIFNWKFQADLDDLLPTHVNVPSGSKVRISYQLEGPAVISVRMQEVFGMTNTPMIANGKLPLLMNLLSPANRSLQLTQDLAGFWSSGYAEVRKEMKGRYPKHFWPEKPEIAEATNRVKSKMGKR